MNLLRKETNLSTETNYNEVFIKFTNRDIADYSSVFNAFQCLFERICNFLVPINLLEKLDYDGSYIKK